jgi:NADH-quinone oxidoreductase subunit G
MRQEIIHKPKGVVFGPTIVYDAERCILCTRCIRVCDEVAKDPVLSIRERGNLGEIVVSPGRALDNDYTLMTEHVCPVGALTSSDFRFKARVWFLRSARTICQGCATGCSAYLDYDPRSNTPHRHRPRENMKVNTYWMCDEGMLSYRRVVERRLLGALVGGEDASIDEALDAARTQLKGTIEDPSRVAIVLSAQHSNEDNFALVTLAKTYLGTGEFYLSGRPLGRGDEILMSEDKNPNTRGVLQIASTTPPKPFAELIAAIDAGKYQAVIALGAEIEVPEPEAHSALSKLKGVVTIAAHEGPLVKAAHVALPACVWAEVEGTYVNRQGIAQRSERALRARGESRPAWDLVARLGRAFGYAMDFRKLADVHKAMAPEAFAALPAETQAVGMPSGERPAAPGPVPMAPVKPEVNA